MYLTKQRRFTSHFYKINNQKHCRWMIWNALNANCVVLLHKYMHRDVYDTYQLRVIDDALLQAMPHHTLAR